MRIRLLTNIMLHWDMQTYFHRQLDAGRLTSVNSSPPGQNGLHFADDIFRCIFMNEKSSILIKISLKFVPKGPIDNNPALFRWWLGAE